MSSIEGFGGLLLAGTFNLGVDSSKPDPFYSRNVEGGGAFEIKPGSVNPLEGLIELQVTGDLDELEQELNQKGLTTFPSERQVPLVGRVTGIVDGERSSSGVIHTFKAPPPGGFAREIVPKVRVGDRVKTGQLLAVATSSEKESALQNAERGVESARIKLTNAFADFQRRDVAIGQAGVPAAQTRVTSLRERVPIADRRAALAEQKVGQVAAQLSSSETRLARFDSLRDQGAFPQSEYEKLKVEVDGNRVALNEAKQAAEVARSDARVSRSDLAAAEQVLATLQAGNAAG